MRAVRKISQAIAALSTVIGMAMAQDQMPWQANLDAAQQLAAKTNRLVLIHCWTPTCQPCARLDKEVFSRGETGRALDPNFVLVKLNCEESPGTARMYGVSSVPTDVIITPAGHLVASIPSPPSMNQYVAEMNRAANGYKELSRNAQTPGTAPAASAPNGAVMPPMSVGASTNDAAAPNHAATPASAVMPAANTTANMPAGNAAAPPVGQQAYSSDRYAEYFKQQQSTAAPGGNAAMPPAGSAAQAPGYSASAAAPQQSTAAPQQPAAAPPVSTNPYAAAAAAATTAPAAPTYAPGSIANVYPNAAPQTAAQAPVYGQQPVYQQPPQQSHAPAAAHVAAQLPPGSAPLGFDGYCPVSLAERNAWVLGEKTWGVVHRGRTYLFAGPEEQKKFWANPDIFSPVMSGNDPVLALDNQVTVPGKREFGVVFNNRVYLFADEASLQRFEQNTNRYAAEALQAMR